MYGIVKDSISIEILKMRGVGYSLLIYYKSTLIHAGTLSKELQSYYDYHLLAYLCTTVLQVYH